MVTVINTTSELTQRLKFRAVQRRLTRSHVHRQLIPYFILMNEWESHYHGSSTKFFSSRILHRIQSKAREVRNLLHCMFTDYLRTPLCRSIDKNWHVMRFKPPHKCDLETLTNVRDLPI